MNRREFWKESQALFRLLGPCPYSKHRAHLDAILRDYWRRLLTTNYCEVEFGRCCCEVYSCDGMGDRIQLAASDDIEWALIKAVQVLCNLGPVTLP